MSLIMGQVIPDQCVVSVLEIEKLNFSSLFGIYFHCYPVLFSTQVSDIGPSWYSCFFTILAKRKGTSDCTPSVSHCGKSVFQTFLLG